MAASKRSVIGALRELGMADVFWKDKYSTPTRWVIATGRDAIASRYPGVLQEGFYKRCLKASPATCTSAISFSPAALVRSVILVLFTFSAATTWHLILAATSLLTGVLPCR